MRRRGQIGGVWALALWGALAGAPAGGTRLRGRAPPRRLLHEEIDYGYGYYYDNDGDVSPLSWTFGPLLTPYRPSARRRGAGAPPA